jgi:hypothetical protein
VDLPDKHVRFFAIAWMDCWYQVPSASTTLVQITSGIGAVLKFFETKEILWNGLLRLEQLRFSP